MWPPYGWSQRWNKQGNSRRAHMAPSSAENHSTCGDASAMIGPMFRYAFLLAASAVTDAPKAAVPIFATAVDGARS